MAMIKPEPVDPSIDMMIDMGNPEDRNMADELQSSMTGDEGSYSRQRYLYNFPFMRDPKFLHFLKSEVYSYLLIHEPEFTWEIKHSNSFDEFIDAIWDPRKYKDVVMQNVETDEKYRSYAQQVKHTFGQEDKSGILDEQLKDIFAKHMRSMYWDYWRKYYKLPLDESYGHRSPMQKAMDTEHREHMERLQSSPQYARGYRYGQKFAMPPYVDELSGIVDYEAIDIAIQNVIRMDGPRSKSEEFKEGFYKVFEQIEDQFLQYQP